MRIGPRTLLLSAVAATVLSTAAPAAGTPDSTPTPATIVVTGMTDSGAMLDGYFTATDFAIEPAGNLIVNGMLNGRLSTPGVRQRGVSQPIVLPVDRQDSATTCRMLNLAVGPGESSAGGEALHIKQGELTLMQSQGPGSLLLVPFCDAARRLRGPNLDPAVLIPLNQIVQLIAARSG